MTEILPAKLMLAPMQHLRWQQQFIIRIFVFFALFFFFLLVRGRFIRAIL